MQIEVCSVDSIPEGESRGFIINEADVEIFGVKKCGEIYFYQNCCPHYGTTPLNWEPNDFLSKDGNLIQCCSHGALFAIENGECLQGPCQGRGLQAIDYEVKEGNIWIKESDL
ncbi:Rieske 2Fe-2S domain-containing protein [Haliea sp. AH-315-K21]|uniref:Rieske domain-containing protein n=1 Tax=SAR86 cluster bacterium TaxID=2030880 RepID=A0A2A5CAJ7_9GAMM|nr:Rieske 2Fe-2S domain-containing protein [Haliea sp. AH-315-K21]MBN4075547.1 Rieske 2Fe-2S domain-containing protein [Gammaproteobacteria bacterium AH-315-E17]PCJ40605.1 MAG: hypothetical protein COA71_10185 [SAR86 cluster bacterium]